MVECPRCGGAGEVQHPRWGSRSCPSPEIVCPFCGGRGEVSQDDLDDWNDEQDAIARRRNRPLADKPFPDAEEPF